MFCLLPFSVKDSANFSLCQTLSGFNTSNARISVKQTKKQYIYLTNSQQTANMASSSTHRQSYVPSPFFPVCPHNWHKK